MFRATARILINRRRAALFALIGFLIGGALMSLGAAESGTVDSAIDRLPVNVDSTKVVELQEQLPKSETTSALVIYAPQSGTFTEADLVSLNQLGAQIQEFGISLPGTVPALIPSPDLNVAITSVALPATEDFAVLAESVKEIREFAAESSPAGIDIYVSGEAGISTDIASVFDGANITLLMVTAGVVALLLLVTYRSPILWLIPLLVVGIADRAGVTLATKIGELTNVPMDESVPGIVSVLIFGAGTDYALLLIARYRDELRLVENKYEAMQNALTKSFDPIGASATTVVLALATLLLSAFPVTRGLGLAGAIGVMTAMFFALFVLPPFLVLFGRRAFWPLIPKVGDTLSADRAGIWGRIGKIVKTRPQTVLVLGIVALFMGMSGLTQTQLGLSQNEQFLEKPESIAGLEVLATGFAGGTSDPVIVLTASENSTQVIAELEKVTFVNSVTPTVSTTEIQQLEVVTTAISGTDAAEAEISVIREALAAIPDTFVGGTTAEQVDRNSAIKRDWFVIVPIVLILVLGVLVRLLKSILAPVLLVLTVIANYLASLGISWFIFSQVFGFVGLEAGVPLLAFLFLVALGVDYNIFLVTRAREDAVEIGTAAGMLRALASTGGVITSAGILLAAVFAVLGVLPLVTLTQIGVIVCVGVLLDTLLVRTVIVPAMGVLLAEKFWWPGKLSAKP